MYIIVYHKGNVNRQLYRVSSTRRYIIKKYDSISYVTLIMNIDLNEVKTHQFFFLDIKVNKKLLTYFFPNSHIYQ